MENIDETLNTVETLQTMLKDIPADAIMYYLHSRRDDVVVVQWYNPQHIKDITGCSADIETIKEHWESIVDYLQSEWITGECNDHLSEMSTYAEDWGLEDLFDKDEEDEE